MVNRFVLFFNDMEKAQGIAVCLNCFKYYDYIMISKMW